MSTINLRLPESLLKQTKKVIKREGVSLDQFIASAISEKMAAYATQDYLEMRTKQADETKFKAALSKIPDVEPEKNDKI